ncbi:hypothetical protein MAM1_0043d03036 [Mucor ambiguus]|uniref:Uncharacterized protein n=1 Tax=Mucor ambiguus TaxID=91626 RepID=A0A0C9M3J4_9FUNG|nr:hypothetical protein MAM1_0043d03036 [Mucor ambiguus]
MQVRLTKKITNCLTGGCSLSNLKKDCLALERIERGTVSDAENKAGFKSTASSSASTQSSTSASKAIVHKDILRTCSTNFNSIIRADLPPDIRDTLIIPLSTTPEQATSLSLQVLKLILLFNKSTIKINNKDAITMVDAQGFQINELVPEEFHVEMYESRTMPPLPASVKEDLKVLRESKVILDHILNQEFTTAHDARRLIGPSFPANGLDGEINIMKLYAPGLYAVQHIGSVDIPSNINSLYMI